MVLAPKIYAWQTTLGEHWQDLQFGTAKVNRVDNQLQFEVTVYLGQLAPEFISVELYADPINGQGYVIIPMARGEKIIDTKGGYT